MQYFCQNVQLTEILPQLLLVFNVLLYFVLSLMIKFSFNFHVQVILILVWLNLF